MAPRLICTEWNNGFMSTQIVSPTRASQFFNRITHGLGCRKNIHEHLHTPEQNRSEVR